MITEQPVIATSIMPRRIEAQQVAISSWQRLGFRVVSVNQPGEVDLLHADFPGVHFVTAVNVPGAGFNVAVIDLFTVLSATGSEVCGIVNSDISLVAGDGFLEFVVSQAATGVLFGSRIDIFSSGQEIEKDNAFGFDYFFFPRNLLCLCPPAGFCLGTPYWDYWLPLVALSRGVKVFRLVTPVARHETHETSWDEMDLAKQWRIFCDCFSDQLIATPSVEFSSLISRVIKFDWREGADMILNCLHYQVETVFFARGGSDFGLIAIHLDTFNAMRFDLVSYRMKLEAHQGQLEALLSSRSWKLTEPARRLKSCLRDIWGRLWGTDCR